MATYTRHDKMTAEGVRLAVLDYLLDAPAYRSAAEICEGAFGVDTYATSEWAKSIRRRVGSAIRRLGDKRIIQWGVRDDREQTDVYCLSPGVAAAVRLARTTDESGEA